MTYIERASSIARQEITQNPAASVAVQPAYYFSPSRAHLLSYVTVDVADVRDKLTELNPDGYDFPALGILLAAPEDGLGSDRAAFVRTPMKYMGDVIHYPCIEIAIPYQIAAVERRLPQLNTALRHEVSHSRELQAHSPFYDSKAAQAAARVGGVATSIAGALVLAEQHDPLTIGATLALAPAALMAAIAPLQTLHGLDPREWRADYFAWRNANFQPIALR
jgi:hypothetical protein